MRKVAIAFAIIVCCIVSSLLIATIASSFGFLFSGLDSALAVSAAVFVSAGVAAIAAAIFKGYKGFLRWIAAGTIAILCELVVIGLLAHLQTRQHIQIFMEPASVPEGLVIHNGRSIMFSSYIHFTGPPEKIVAILKVKELAEVPAEISELVDYSGFNERERTKALWDWWQPIKMSNPKFFYRHHKSEAIQGWSEGWWVNDKTNEVYALIGG